MAKAGPMKHVEEARLRAVNALRRAGTGFSLWGLHSRLSGDQEIRRWIPRMRDGQCPAAFAILV